MGQKAFATITPQGDGNPPKITPLYFVKIAFATITPQGDGNRHHTLCCVQLGSCSFRNHYPARGRKPFILSIPVSYLTFATITPQGDGNWYEPISRLCSRCPLSQPLPRKGTETLQDLLHCLALPDFRNHYPARGRKHDTLAR